MNRMFGLFVAGLAGALVALLALSFASNAFAQGPAPQPTQPMLGAGGYGNAQMMGRGQRGPAQMGGSAESLVGMAAAELGIPQAELIAQLGTDGTIAAALSAGGIDPAAFIDRFVVVRADRLDAAVAAGTLTREEADARLLTARSMATARINQAFSVLGPGGQGPHQGQGQCSGDADGDGVCDQMPAGGQGCPGGGRGPRR